MSGGIGSGAEFEGRWDEVSTSEQVAPHDRWILHFTHVDNLPAIVERGYLVCDAVAQQGLIRAEVGDLAIKQERRRRTIPIDPGGRVGDYVPFYFAPRSPMMYRIACDHRDRIAGRYPDGDRPLVYLVSSVGAIIDLGLAWVATDGNAANATTEFSSDLTQLEEMVDWPLLRAVRWNNVPDDLDRQRRRMAEFLVHGQVPLQVVHQVGTYSDRRAEAVRTILAGTALHGRVVVRPSWYYGYERG